jgi:hypothetical protein
MSAQTVDDMLKYLFGPLDERTQRALADAMAVRRAMRSDMFNPSKPGNEMFNPSKPGNEMFNPNKPGNEMFNPSKPGNEMGAAGFIEIATVMAALGRAKAFTKEIRSVQPTLKGADRGKVEVAINNLESELALVEAAVRTVLGSNTGAVQSPGKQIHIHLHLEG